MREWLAFGDAALRFLFLNWAVQSSLILGAALLIAALPRLRANIRHGLLAASLVLAVLAPVVGVAASSSLGRWSSNVNQKASAKVAIRAQNRVPNPRRPGASPNPQNPTPNTHTTHHLPAGMILLATWGAIALWRLTWLAGGLWTLRRLLRRARPVDGGRLHEACGYRAEEVPVLESGCVSIPSVAGVSRPCILLPEGLTEALAPQTLREVLLHEEAHARRRDPLYLLLGAFAGALLFWNPLAEAARRRMEAAAEDACDAYVLSRGVEATVYARTLLRVLEGAAPARRQALTCLLGRYSGRSAGAELKRRVALILSGGGRSSPAVAAIAGLAMAGAVVSTAGVNVGTRPRLPVMRRRPPALAWAPKHPAPRHALPERQLPEPSPTPAADREPPRPAMIPVARGEARPQAMEPAATEGPVLAESRLTLPRESRYVVYLLDVSSSMRPHQETARQALLALAGELSPRDTFNVVTFAGDYAAFSPGAVSTGGLSLHRVRVWLEDLPEKSGTNLLPALQAALAMPEVTQVVIISDGEAWRQPAGRASLAALLERENRFGAAVQELIVAEPDRPAQQLLPGAPPARVPRETLEAGQQPHDLLP